MKLAAEIEEYKKENARLREALEQQSSFKK